jgi:L-alanine-DL-glutamate epimerase-like enolase superfamily enzyme
MEPKMLCQDLTVDRIELNQDGMICAPDKPGMGVEINVSAIKKYLVDVEIKVAGKTLFTTPIL